MLLHFWAPNLDLKWPVVPTDDGSHYREREARKGSSTPHVFNDGKPFYCDGYVYYYERNGLFAREELISRPSIDFFLTTLPRLQHIGFHLLRYSDSRTADEIRSLFLRLLEALKWFPSEARFEFIPESTDYIHGYIQLLSIPNEAKDAIRALVAEIKMHHSRFVFQSPYSFRAFKIKEKKL